MLMLFDSEFDSKVMSEMSVASGCFPRPQKVLGMAQPHFGLAMACDSARWCGPRRLRESCRHQVSSSEFLQICFSACIAEYYPAPLKHPPLAFAGGAHRRGEERRFFHLWADGLGLKTGVSTTVSNDPNDPNNPGCYSLC